MELPRSTAFYRDFGWGEGVVFRGVVWGWVGRNESWFASRSKAVRCITHVDGLRTQKSVCIVLPCVRLTFAQ